MGPESWGCSQNWTQLHEMEQETEKSFLVAIKMADLNDAHFFENQHLHLQKDFPTQEGTPLTC
jgi:hypothetical protein